MDVRDKKYLYYSTVEEKRIKRLSNMLDMADCMVIALGRFKFKNGKNVYSNWCEAIKKEMFPEEKPKERIGSRFWNKLKRSKRLN